MIANALGGIAVLDGSHAWYRRHEQSLSGSHASKPFGQQVKNSRIIGVDHYRFLAEVARGCRGYLTQVAAETGDVVKKDLLSISADYFGRLAEVQDYRAALYQTRGALPRAILYCHIWQRRGYFGQPFTSMGFKSAIKDAVRVLTG